jgi:hypothetical protein
MNTTYSGKLDLHDIGISNVLHSILTEENPENVAKIIEYMKKQYNRDHIRDELYQCKIAELTFMRRYIIDNLDGTKVPSYTQSYVNSIPTTNQKTKELDNQINFFINRYFF